jgi:ABC-type sugar transport system permease subunit
MLLIFAAFYLWPAVETVVSSLFRWSLLRPWRPEDPSTWNYVGANNFQATLADTSFWNAATNSLIWLVLFPALVIAMALLVTVLIWHVGRGAVLFRTVFVLPMTISLAATGVIWSFVYNPDPDVGVLNAVLRLLHLDGSVTVGPLRLETGQWLADVGSIDLGFTTIHLVNLALIIPAFWAFTGFGVVTLTAGLSSLSSELIDSARVDGCRPLHLVRYVLIPHLRQPLMVVYVVSVIFSLRTFDIVYVMTQGGPGQDTMVLALQLWQQAFAFLTEPKGGMAATIAVLMSAVLIVLSYPYLKTLLRKESR